MSNVTHSVYQSSASGTSEAFSAVTDDSSYCAGVQTNITGLASYSLSFAR